jgi:DNA-binding XRE family transcriptional regulator
MSALTKKHPTENKINISWHGNHYAVPLDVMERYKVEASSDSYESIDDLFGDLTEKSSEPGVLLRGLRYREGLSQIEFSKLINISQTNLSAMENGRRPIGRELAKRIAGAFNIDYRILL